MCGILSEIFFLAEVLLMCSFFNIFVVLNFGYGKIGNRTWNQYLEFWASY